MTSVLGVPDEFESSDYNSYTIVADQSGHWMDSLGRPCHLLSIDSIGETKWIVTRESEIAGDLEAINHFDLTPWWRAGERDRRDEGVDRRQRERRLSARRKPTMSANDDHA